MIVPMHALLIFLNEPLPSPGTPQLSVDNHPHESVRRYRAMVAVLLQQLEGLRNTHVRFCYSPDDAGDAIAFWLLPLLRGDVIKRTNDFLFTPHKKADSISIDFHPQGSGDILTRRARAAQQAFENGFSKVALMDHTCLECGSRWIHTAMLQLKSSTCIIGPSHSGSCYLLAATSQGAQWLVDSTAECHHTAHQNAQSHGLTPLLLPPLNSISCPNSWDITLNSTIGGKLTAALKKEI